MAVDTSAGLQDNIRSEFCNLCRNLSRMQTAGRNREDRLQIGKRFGNLHIICNDFPCLASHLARDGPGVELISAGRPDQLCNRPHGDSVMRISGQCPVHRSVDMDWDIDTRSFCKRLDCGESGSQHINHQHICTG